MKRIVIIAALAMAMAACGSRDEANGGVTAEESAGLNNAAEMLDASPDSLVAPSEAPLGNGEAPTISDAATNQQPAASNGAASAP